MEGDECIFTNKIQYDYILFGLLNTATASLHHCMSQKHCISNFIKAKSSGIQHKYWNEQSSANSLEVTLKGEWKLLLAPF